MRKKFSLLVWLALLCLVMSCEKKNANNDIITSGKDFSWKSELKISDIPDFPVKGSLNGKEVNLEYINFEQWRGSGDNVLNFTNLKPKNNCGYVESNNSFHLIYKAGEIKTGELLKATFDRNLDGYVAYFDTTAQNNNRSSTSNPWNCALIITSIEDKIVKGKIAVCFNDGKKSWLAGSFEAIRCFN